MTAVNEAFWAVLDKQVADTVSRGNAVLRGAEKASQPQVLSAPALAKYGSEPVRMPVAATEWGGIVDIINSARVQAEAQRDQLREQAAAFDQVVQEMSEDAASVRQQVLVLEAQHQEAKAELERQIVEIRAQAEQQVRDIQAQADAQIAQAHTAIQSAEERAAIAEDWLKRIEEASRTLMPSLETTPIRRAA